MPLYIAKSGDLEGCYACLTDNFERQGYSAPYKVQEWSSRNAIKTQHTLYEVDDLLRLCLCFYPFTRTSSRSSTASTHQCVCCQASNSLSPSTVDLHFKEAANLLYREAANLCLTSQASASLWWTSLPPTTQPLELFLLLYLTSGQASSLHIKSLGRSSESVIDILLHEIIYLQVLSSTLLCYISLFSGC